MIYGSPSGFSPGSPLCALQPADGAAQRLHAIHSADILSGHFDSVPVLGLPQIFEIFRNWHVSHTFRLNGRP